MTSIDPVPINPEDIGRDNDIDGTLGTSIYLSEVKVINITPHEVSEIKTSVITLNQDAFPVTLPNDQDTPPISVFADNIVERGYVQWEPMGDLYPATINSPLGSYKYLRVKWDCYVPAGSDSVNYTTGATGGQIPGPYDYYAEQVYTFRSIEPIGQPNFTLTPGVLSALGFNDCDRPTYFEFSAHGYVNRFNFAHGLYGQDKQAAFPDGSSLIPATRDVVYDRHFNQIGSVNEPPHTTGGAYLAKEYSHSGRIVPELDYDGAGFTVVQEGDIFNIGNEVCSVYTTSGRDAPPFWYNFHYELQHQKNIIPFTFIWGVNSTTYDAGTYDPRGAEMDLQDLHGRVTGTAKASNNHGPRVRSMDWVNYFKQFNAADAETPNIFHSQDDITFSVIGPEVVCHASSVTVCATQSEITQEGLSKTILNWFNKSNQKWYDIDVFGYNFLPSFSCWVLRGCLHINDTYLPTNLTPRDINSQASNKLEKTWAIDQNFSERKLFTAYKNTYPDPPQEILEKNIPSRPFQPTLVNKYQAAAYYANTMWDSPVNIGVTYQPIGTTNVSRAGRDAFYGQPNFEDKTVGYIKGLHDPWASNIMGLSNRPSQPGEQPGFNYIGVGGLLANAGLADARFLEASIDLEWNRCTIETERNGKLIDQFGEAWKVKRQVADFPTIGLPAVNDAVKQLTNNPNYNEWLNKSIDAPEFQGRRTLIDNDSILNYIGTGPVLNGTSAANNFKRGWDSRNLYGGPSRSKEVGFARFTPYLSTSLGSVRTNYIGYPISKHQHAIGYPNSQLFLNDDKQAFTVAHFAFGHAISYAMISGDKITLELIDHYMRAISVSHGDADHTRKLFDEGRSFVARNFRVGRQEGRAVHALVGGISVSRNRKLAEQVIYKYNRRFWNLVHVTNFEEYPLGVPGKPWRSLWYPYWAGGIRRELDSQGLPVEIDLGLGINRDFYNTTKLGYAPTYGEAGDLALRIYNAKGLKITDINPNFVRGNAGNAASWNYAVGSGRVEYPVWKSKYDDLDRSNNFPASGLSAIDNLPGAPNGSVLVSSIPYRLKYRIDSPSNDPWRCEILSPSLNDPTKTVSALPGLCFSSNNLTESQVGSVLTQDYISQSYQQSLVYNFIAPFPDIFHAYSTIFAGRAAEGLTPEIYTIHNDYNGISEELADASEMMNEYFVRVGRTLSKNLVLLVDDTSPVGAGITVLGYNQAPYSPTNLYCQYTDRERTVYVNEDGLGYFEPVERIHHLDSSGNPTTTDLVMAYKPTGGGYLVLSNPAYYIGHLRDGTWGTKLWTLNSIIWAWDVIYKHGDLNDTRNIQALETLRQCIEEYIGTVPFNSNDFNNITLIRDDFYIGRVYGEFGYPGVGSEPDIIKGFMGDPEFSPWIMAASDDPWKDRTLNTTLKLLRGSIQGSTNLSTTFETISANRRIYIQEAQPSALYNPSKGLYPFFNQFEPAKDSIPRSLEAIRIGMSSVYVDGGATNQFDFTILEDALNSISSVNCQANFRFFIEAPEQLYPGTGTPRFPNSISQGWKMPLFLRPENGGPAATYYHVTTKPGALWDTSGYVPDYTDPVLINECVRLIQELGARYDGDPRIATMQVGFAGHWGEWNQYEAWQWSNEPVNFDKDPPVVFLDALINAMDSAFNITPVTGRFLDGLTFGGQLPGTPLSLTSTEVNVGIHDDSFAWLTLDNTSPYYTYTQMQFYGVTEKWRTIKQGGEVRPEIQYLLDVLNDEYQGSYSRTPQNIFECIRLLATTDLSVAIMFSEYYRAKTNNTFVVTPQQEENLKNVIYQLGYNFFIQNAIIPTNLSRGENFDLTVNIKNIGSAPFYPNWPVVLRFENGGNSYEIETDWNLSSIMPNQALDLTQSINGIQFDQALPNAASITAKLYIKKPAAFLRDVTFMNAEHIESTPYMDLGQLNLFTGPTKFLAGELSGSTEVSATIKAITTKVRYPSDHVNESFYPKRQGPDIVNIPGGGGGPQTRILVGEVIGSTNLAVDEFISTIPLEGLLTFQTLLDGVITSATTFEGTIIGATILQGSDDPPLFSSDRSLSSLLLSGSTDIILDTELTLFKKLPDFALSGETSLSANNLARILSTTFTLIGSTDLSATYLASRNLTDLILSGETSVSINEIYSPNVEGILEGQTTLNGILSLVFGNLRGQAGPRDFSLELSEESFSKSQYSDEVDRIDSTYTGLRGRKKQNFEVELFKELSSRSIGDNKVTEIYKDTLKYLISKFSEFVYVNDQNEVVEIPCWHGSSERVVAKIKQESNIILPIISVYRSGNKLDELRRRSSSLIVYEKYWDKQKQRAVRVASIAPNPINISYRINVWTKYQEDMDHITEQVHRLFNPDLEVKTKYNSTTKAFMVEESENNETNLPDGQDRVIRKVFTIDVQSYVPNPKFLITNTGKIEAFNAEVCIPIK